MRTVYEFRVDEKFAPKLFSPNEGIRLGDSVRKIHITKSDSRLYKIGELQKEHRKKLDKPFFYGWNIRNYYSKKEIESAKLFHLEITTVFEPAGEECGTVYDYSKSCQLCGVGRQQKGDLILDFHNILKNKSIARTIADELIISQHLAKLLVNAKITGFQLRSVKHNSTWYQVMITSNPILMIPPTEFGIDPFDSDPKGLHRCSFGHVSGLNLLSEIWVSQEEWDGSDIVCTRDSVGVRRGLLVPRSLLLISPRLNKLLEENKIKGYQLEIAHFKQKLNL